MRRHEAIMERRSVEAIVRALNEADVRYLVVGGLAVVAHGYVRFTADFDLMIDLTEANVARLEEALQGLKYAPLVPVQIRELANEDTRRRWMIEKNMIVFSLESPLHRQTTLDIFVENPIDFDAAYERASLMEPLPKLSARIISLDDLIFLKRLANRPLDGIDITELELLHSLIEDDGNKDEHLGK